jgi:ABC-type branched-subunit amino acid transport system ATPase component
VGYGATLMCLDEPAAGLNPEDSELVGAALRQFSKQSRCAMLVVEHKVVDQHRRGQVMSTKLQSFLALEDVSVTRP